MQIALFNTLERKIEVFKPIKTGEVSLYCCGPTVYNYAHIGNFRTYIFEDLLVRTLGFAGYKIQHVMNITDIGHLTGDGDCGEDKMLKSAQEKKQSVLEVAHFFTQRFFDDAQLLNISSPTVVCVATDHIEQIIQMIQVLQDKGLTYEAQGNIYFDTSKDPGYGNLRGYGLSISPAQHRIDVDHAKKNHEDFVLWFTKSKFEDQALHWPSPWGEGYPGWHIECSAMSFHYLGTHFDIHCGGIDHVSIHHTNEIAQNHGYCGSHGAKFWLHGEFLTINEEKMAKTGGHFLTVSMLSELGFDPLDYRYLCLGTHYRKQLNFHDEALSSAKNARRKLINKIKNLADIAQVSDPSQLRFSQDNKYYREFVVAISTDLNMPEALAVVWMLLKDDSIREKEKLALLYQMEKILAVGIFDNKDFLQKEVLPSELQALIHKREQARKDKDFQKADSLRDQLAQNGIVIEDTVQGTVWKYKN
ncbi:MAG: cysteine--tRNA ligase [Spirochaetia bacterium]